MSLESVQGLPLRDDGAGARVSPRKRRSTEKLLLRISAAVGSRLSLSDVLDTILEESMHAVSAQEGSILLYEELRDRLEMLACRGLPEEVKSRGYIARKGSIAEWVMANNRPLIITGPVTTRRAYSAGPSRPPISSSLCLPLRAKGRIIGTLNLNRTAEDLGPFRPGDMRVMTLVAAHAAETIQIARLYQAIQQSERLAAIGQTIAGVAHCIKNLISSVRAGIFVCNRAFQEEAKGDYNKGSALLDQAITRITVLTNDMLEFSKQEQVPVLNEVGIADLFEQLCTLKQSTANQKNVALEFEVPENAPRLKVDSGQLLRCLVNLIENALDASAAGGRVVIRAQLDSTGAATRHLSRRADVAYVIRVVDSGSGVAADVAMRIFDPFFSTKGSRGTGLGLAVTQKIIRDHGGDVVYQAVPGGGAEFAIYLPA